AAWPRLAIVPPASAATRVKATRGLAVARTSLVAVARAVLPTGTDAAAVATTIAPGRAAAITGARCVGRSSAARRRTRPRGGVRPAALRSALRTIRPIRLALPPRAAAARAGLALAILGAAPAPVPGLATAGPTAR